jgi:hypothetical protein
MCMLSASVDRWHHCLENSVCYYKFQCFQFFSTQFVFFQGHSLKMISHEVFIVVMKITVLWDMMPSFLHRAQHFGIMCFLHIMLWTWRQLILQKCWSISTKLYSITSQHFFSPLWLYSQILGLASSMKLSVSFQFLDLGQSAGLFGQVISLSQGLC